jgi:pimeloyl-ACP methyl ester carboxylesterase
MKSTHDALRALYVHGLESGPRGNKPRALAEAGFHVVSEQMPCGQKAVTRDPAVIAGAIGAVALAGVATARWGLRGLSTALVTAAATQTAVKQALVRRMFERSVAVQLRSLRDHRIDVVMGSSFGGAVALELLRRGAWSGPTVLLCPAHLRVCERAATAWKPLDSLPDPARVIVVHGREDEVVPYAHSEQLAGELGVELVTVSDDHRLTKSATTEGLAEWVRRVARV